MARLAYARVRDAKVDPGPLLHKAGLTLEQIEDSGTRMNVLSQIDFLNLAADALDDPFLGFHLARDFDLREMGLLYYVFASSEVLCDAIHRVTRYGAIANEGVSARCTERKPITVVFQHKGVARHPDRHQIEGFAMAFLRVCRQLTGQRLRAESVQFIHHRDECNPELAGYFGCEIKFGARSDRIALADANPDMPLVGADPYLNKLLIAYCDEALAARPVGRDSLRVSIENTIVPLLPHGKPRLGDIARRLAMSRRTLARRLAAEGVTFAGILDDLRYSLAKRYLSEAELSISKIAWLLGYREVSAFTHAFKRLAGQTPRQARAGTAPLQPAETTSQPDGDARKAAGFSQENKSYPGARTSASAAGNARGDRQPRR